MSWLDEVAAEVVTEAGRLRAAGLFPYLRELDRLGPRAVVDGAEVVNLTSNDYLGLARDPAVTAATGAALARFGTGLGSSPLQATTALHRQLEERLAAWLGRDGCAVFPSGWQALTGAVTAFLDGDAVAVVDSLAHASILDGAFTAHGRAAGVEIRVIRHSSLRALERILAAVAGRRVLVAVEGLYGVDGDLAPLAGMVEICRRHGAALLVDDAHGLGCLGPGGRGTAALAGVLEEVDLLVGTLSKAFGGAGGFVAGDRGPVEHLRLRARPYVYSAALPPAQVAAALAALDRIEAGDDLRAALADRAAQLRHGLAGLGYDLGAGSHHVCPVMIGDEARAMTLGARLLAEQQVLMLPFVYPGVPRGAARLRCNVTAAHTAADLERVVAAMGRLA